jgi:hypothetical protein
MQLIHFPRSLTAIARLGLAFVMVALTLLGSARSAAAATNPIINRVGSGFEFHVNNGSTAVTWSVQAGTKQPVFDANGILVFPIGSNVVTRSSGSSSQTSFDPFIGGLRPNTLYFYILRAGSTQSSGTLGTTLHRTVVVNFNSITITNDSDSTGKGELTFNFRVNGAYIPSLDFSLDLEDVVTISPNRSATKVDGQATMPLQVEVQDDDCFSTCIMSPPDFRSGSNSDNDWATAGASITFTNDNTNSVSKSVPYSVNSFVGFNGTAQVSVTYSA